MNSELPVTVNRTCCNRNKFPVIFEVRRGWLWIAVALRGNVVVITYCRHVPGPVTHSRGPWIPAAGPCLVPSLWHLLSRCPWLTRPCCIAGERKKSVGCLLACLLPHSLCEAKIGHHQLCLLVEDHLISSDSPAPCCLPPIAGSRKKRRKPHGLELCGSPCLHPGSCVFQRYLVVGVNPLWLAVSQHWVVACRFSLHSLGDISGQEQSHLPNVARGPWSLLN